MNIFYAEQAKDDVQYWKKTDRKKIARIETLLKAIQADPFAGIGKPEPLKFEYQGYWSRRIDQEHRLVYKVHQGTIYVAQCRYHY